MTSAMVLADGDRTKGYHVCLYHEMFSIEHFTY